MRAAGLLIAVVGLALAARSAQLLAGRGRPRRGPRPPLVLAGPYLRMRNPLYAGVVVATTGIALAMHSWLAAALALVTAAAAHAWVVKFEEPKLRDRFGVAYAEYLKGVPRWVPRRHRTDD